MNRRLSDRTMLRKLVKLRPWCYDEVEGQQDCKYVNYTKCPKYEFCSALYLVESELRQRIKERKGAGE